MGIKINIKAYKKIGIEIKGQPEEVIEDFQQDIGSAVTSPEARHLITVENNYEQLSEEKGEIFHSVTGKLDPTVGYLCTIVPLKNEDDWKIMERVLKYIKRIANNMRIIEGIQSE